MRVIAKRPHVADCFADPSKAGGRRDPWCLDRKMPTVTADKRGGNTGGTTSWLRVRCLDPKCSALVLVYEWDLTEQVQALVDQAATA